jgi:hypothetical protein
MQFTKSTDRLPGKVDFPIIVIFDSTQIDSALLHWQCDLDAHLVNCKTFKWVSFADYLDSNNEPSLRFTEVFNALESAIKKYDALIDNEHIGGDGIFQRWLNEIDDEREVLEKYSRDDNAINS